MSTTATPATPPVEQPVPLLTAEEFFAQYAGRHAELVNGVVVEKHVPSLRHGKICVRVAKYLAIFVDDRDLGHVMSNDSLIQVRSSPLTLRGPDVCYFSYARLPKGEIPEGLLPVVPELAVEVRSPSNEWSDIFIKIGEYIKAGVTAILVFDADSATASVYRKDEFQQIFDNGDDLVIPDVLPGFAVPVRKFFE